MTHEDKHCPKHLDIIILSIIIISKDYYELSKRGMRAIGNNYHVFRPKNFRDVQNLHQNKALSDMTPNELKLLPSICWNEKFHPLTIDMTKDIEIVVDCC